MSCDAGMCTPGINNTAWSTGTTRRRTGVEPRATVGRHRLPAAIRDEEGDMLGGWELGVPKLPLIVVPARQKSCTAHCSLHRLRQAQPPKRHPAPNRARDRFGGISYAGTRFEPLGTLFKFRKTLRAPGLTPTALRASRQDSGLNYHHNAVRPTQLVRCTGCCHRSPS